jgi:AAA15 family ATPase/GTPase
MKLTSIQINNFKGLKDIHIEGCSDVNVFVGKNNSGKSSILHAIEIACLAISSGRLESISA